MLAAVPSLRAFAISLSGNVDRADDLVQETLLRAMANIDSFEPGTDMSAWHHPPQPVPLGIPQAPPRSRRRRRPSRR
jgi:RNA polymerase sigma-70 factor (ECF subfamily)